jgi:hypothetical protein
MNSHFCLQSIHEDAPFCTQVRICQANAEGFADEAAACWKFQRRKDASSSPNEFVKTSTSVEFPLVSAHPFQALDIVLARFVQF